MTTIWAATVAVIFALLLGVVVGVLAAWWSVGAPLPRWLPDPLFSAESGRLLVRTCRERVDRLMRVRR